MCRATAGSTVMLNPRNAGSRLRIVMIGRTVALLRGDGRLPVEGINPSDKIVTLRRNAKLAVYQCVAVEGFNDSIDVYLQSSIQQNVHLLGTGSSCYHDGLSLVTEVSSLPERVFPVLSNVQCSQACHPELQDMGLCDI